MTSDMKVWSLLAVSSLLLFAACNHPPSDAGSAQNIPFDRQPRQGVISPSQSLIPSTTTLPEGTTIPVRLQNKLSSASAHAGNAFDATVDDDVTVDEKTLIKSGTPAIIRVLEAKPAAGSRHDSTPEPGYLRLVLVSVDVNDKTVAIETSSIFAKGNSRDNNGREKDVVIPAERRLNFRLAQSVDLK
jgi:hypothetical protein